MRTHFVFRLATDFDTHARTHTCTHARIDAHHPVLNDTTQQKNRFPSYRCRLWSNGRSGGKGGRLCSPILVAGTKVITRMQISATGAARARRHGNLHVPRSEIRMLRIPSLTSLLTATSIFSLVVFHLVNLHKHTNKKKHGTNYRCGTIVGPKTRCRLFSAAGIHGKERRAVASVNVCVWLTFSL